MIATVGWPELLIVLVVLLVLFGASRLPGLARSLGSSLSEFQRGVKEGEESEPTDDESSADASS